MKSQWRVVATRGFLETPALHAFALAIFTLATWLPRGVADAPIRGDPAYFTYLGQAVLRGDPIYSTTFMGYPPLGPLASGGAMALGSAIGIPTHLAPRYAAIALLAACSALAAALARRATGNAWAGLVAGVALAGFGRLGASALSTLEPKHLVVLATLAGGVALQARRPLWVGLAAAGAAFSWQPAAVVVPAGLLASALWEGTPTRSRTVLRFAAGFGIGALPALAYLAATDTWWDWWQRGVVVAAAADLPRAGGDPLRWLEVIVTRYQRDHLLFVLGLAGFVAFAIRALREAPGRALFAPGQGAVPVLTLLWIAFGSLTFGGHPDLFPVLPMVAVWAGVATAELSRRVARTSAPRLRHTVGALVLLVVLAAALRPAPSSPVTLRSQERLLSRIEALSQGGDLVAITAEELYVLRATPAPLPFLRLSEAFVPFLPLVGLRDCDDARARALAIEPGIIALGSNRRSGPCERGFGPFLEQRGYRLAIRSDHLAVYVPERAAAPHRGE